MVAIASLVALLILLAAPLCAVPPLVLTDSQDRYSLGLHLDLLPDPQNQYTIEDITDPAFADHFVPSQQQVPYFGFVAAAWVRFTLQNSTADARTWILEQSFLGNDWLELCIPSATGWTVKKIGDRQPFALREVKHRHYTIRLPIDPGQTRTFYLRSASEVGNLGALLTLWSEPAFAAHDHDEQIALGIYYGIIAVMVLYNLFLFFSLRDRSYLYYVALTLFMGVYFAYQNGIAREYFWPESDQRVWSHWRITVLLGFWAWTWLLSFVRTFLNTRENAPRIHRVLTTMLAFSLLMVGLALADQYQFFAPFTLLYWQLSWILILIVTLVVWRRGYRPARYLLLAWAAMIGGATLNLFFWMGLAPGNAVTLNSLQIGHALEAILLSLALVDRINILRAEKEREAESSRQAQLRAQTAELQARIAEQELQTARTLQMGLMPTTSPQIAGFELAGRCLPASQVGGDFFQYFQRDGRLSLCLADVTGHAMQAAVPVMMFSGVLETEMQYGHPVERLLAQLNRLLCHKLDRRTFVCFAFGEIHLATRTLRLANGGCPYPYHYQAATGEVTELRAFAYPLGVHPESPYPVVEARLAPGDRIVFCSDGLAETRNEQGTMFGFDPLAATIRQGCADGLAAAELIDRLISAVQTFAGGVPQEDDMTCVVLTVNRQD